MTADSGNFGDGDVSNVGTIEVDHVAGDADTNTKISFPGSDVLTFTTTGAERVRVTSGGTLYVGQTASGGARGLDNKVQVSGTDLATSSLALHRYQAGAYGPMLHFAKSRHGTVGSHTIVQDDDVIGSLAFYASDGSDFVSNSAAFFVPASAIAKATSYSAIPSLIVSLPADIIASATCPAS